MLWLHGVERFKQREGEMWTVRVIKAWIRGSAGGRISEDDNMG